MNEKTCYTCGRTLPATKEFFSPRSDWGGKLGGRCRDCMAKYKRAWAEAHREQQAAIGKRWYQEHKEHALQLSREWHRTHKDLVALYNRRSYQAHRARHYDYQRRYRKTHPAWRMSKSIGEMIRRSLHGKKNGCPWESLVGYTAEELQHHLESRFQPGMGWKNYGKWHIDHVRPITAFSFTGPEDPEFRACWALDNLQPMWGRDNIQKGNKEPALLLIDQNSPAKPGKRRCGA